MATELFEPLAVSDGNNVIDAGPLAPVGDEAIQRVTDGSYGTAIQRQKPRSLAVVETQAMKECELLGESAFYGWGAGKDRVEGPSIKCANVLARIWGNCTVRMEPVQDLGDSWVFTAAFVDLETGATMTRQFRQSKKSKVYGKHDAERKDDIRFQIGQSKATRNVILNSLPDWLIQRAMDRAKRGVRLRIEAYVEKNSIEHARKLILKSLAKVGVTEDRVVAKMNRTSSHALTIDDLVLLNGDVRAIDEGAETPAALFPELESNAGIDVTKTNGEIRKQLSEPPDEPVADEPEPEPSDDKVPSPKDIEERLSRCRKFYGELDAATRKEILGGFGIASPLKLREIDDLQLLDAIGDELSDAVKVQGGAA